MKQPRALTPLFLTEMWERFGFYVVQGLLILYLTSELNFSDAKSYAVLGEFTALLYLLPLAGGFFCDRVLGARYSIMIGAVFLGLGYFLLAFYNHSLLFLSLSTIVVGNSLLKPNISSFLGEFYYEDDPRRNAGFTLFYIGINIGGLLAFGGAGFIQERLGWWAAFTAAGIGMILALISFYHGSKTYENRGLPVPRQQIKSTVLRFLSYKTSIVILLALCIVIASLLLNYRGFSGILQEIIGALTLLALFYAASRYQKHQRNKFYVLIILILASVLFWGLFFQMFSAVNLFTKRNVDRHMFGYLFPTPTFFSLESIYILLLGPLLAWLWQSLHIKKRDPTPGMKFSLAMFFMAAAMITLVIGIHAHRPDGFVSPAWIFLFYLFVTLSEMLLSPIGLSMVTELSPPHLSGLMMGIWFMALGFGGQLSGYLGKQASIPKGHLNLQFTNHIYAHAFGYNALYAIIAGVVLLLISPFLKRLLES